MQTRIYLLQKGLIVDLGGNINFGSITVYDLSHYFITGKFSFNLNTKIYSYIGVLDSIPIIYLLYAFKITFSWIKIGVFLM